MRYLDGLRGFAILLVFFFHSYARWPELVPYGNRYSALSRYGWLGVQLFFLISGFVILMTLERNARFLQFLKNRWIRLFPAMLICSVVVYVTSAFFVERPAGQPTPLSLLSSLLFIEPTWIEAATGWNVPPLEGAYWSIYCEFKFYVIGGLLFYRLGRNAFIHALSAIGVIAIAIRLASAVVHVQALSSLTVVFSALSFESFVWFAAGAALYAYTKSSDRRWMAYGLLLCVVGSFALRVGEIVRDHDWSSALFACALSALFATALVWRPIQKWLEWRPLLFFGFISYPLYLVHENILIASIIKIGRFNVIAQTGFIPLVVLLFIGLFAYVVAARLEPRVRRMIAR